MRIIPAVILALLLGSCTPHGTGTFFTSGIKDYTGDGTIQDTSERGGFFSTACYMVTLPAFSLGKSYEHTFRLDGLPIIEGKATEIVLYVPNNFSRKHIPNVNSTVQFAITTADGKQVTRSRSTLGKMTWSSPAQPLRSGFALYQLDTSFFQPVAGERYRLQVIYSSAPGADNAEGYFYLWNGVGGS